MHCCGSGTLDAGSGVHDACRTVGRINQLVLEAASWTVRDNCDVKSQRSSVVTIR